MSNNRYTPRGFTAFNHLPEPRMRKCKWLTWIGITSPRYLLPRNPEHYNVNQLYVPRDTRKGAWK
jgi:hypothetical protein